MPPLTAGLASALIGGGVSLFNSVFNNQSIDRANAANRELLDLQYQRSMQMQNMQNLYNSPASVMSRYTAAGLNPHLIYGQSATPASSVMAPAAQPVTPRRSELDVANSVNALNAMLSLIKTKTEIKNIEANTNKVITDTKGSEIQNSLNEFNLNTLQPLNALYLQKQNDKLDSDIFWQEVNKIDEHSKAQIDIALQNQQLAEMLDTQQIRKEILKGQRDSLKASIASAWAGVAKTKVDTQIGENELKFLNETLDLRVNAEKLANDLGVLDKYNKFIDLLYARRFKEAALAYQQLQIQVGRSNNKRENIRLFMSSVDQINQIFNRNFQTAMSLIR